MNEEYADWVQLLCGCGADLHRSFKNTIFAYTTKFFAHTQVLIALKINYLLFPQKTAGGLLLSNPPASTFYEKQNYYEIGLYNQPFTFAMWAMSSSTLLE